VAFLAEDFRRDVVWRSAQSSLSLAVEVDPRGQAEIADLDLKRRKRWSLKQHQHQQLYHFSIDTDIKNNRQFNNKK
jgi:hypothetical protein